MNLKGGTRRANFFPADQIPQGNPREFLRGQEHPYPMGRGRSPNFWDLLASYVHDMMSNWILYDDLFGREENFTRSIAPPPPELARIFATQMLMPDLFAVFWLFRIYNKEFDKQRHHTASV